MWAAPAVLNLAAALYGFVLDDLIDKIDGLSSAASAPAPKAQPNSKADRPLRTTYAEILFDGDRVSLRFGMCGCARRQISCSRASLV